MDFCLLGRPLAAKEWTLYDQMTLSDSEQDEFLRELFLYTISLPARQRKWIIAPISKKGRRKETDCFITLIFEETTLGPRWHMQTIHPNDTAPEYVQQIVKLSVLLGNRDSPSAHASVVHLTHCDTLEGFFYIKILSWCTRCRSMEECAALFDAMALNADRIREAQEELSLKDETITHLLREVLHEHDPIRHASMQRKIQLLRVDIDRLQRIALPLGVQSAHPSVPVTPSSRKPYSSVASSTRERNQ